MGKEGSAYYKGRHIMTESDKIVLGLCMSYAVMAMSFVVFSVSVAAGFFDTTQHDACLKFSITQAEYQECMK